LHTEHFDLLGQGLALAVLGKELLLLDLGQVAGDVVSCLLPAKKK
ncbi:hypothetical protein GR268_44615, partial [Rhizobium leguminosarum]|nr:hypothetical protein [Rhizobium leguminosarum]